MKKYEKKLIEKSFTENYFKDLIKKTLKNKNDIDKFMKYIYQKYGVKEWWTEWLGYSYIDIVHNIREVFNSLRDI